MNQALGEHGEGVYSSTRKRRSASAVTVLTGIRIFFSPNSPTLTSAYSAPPLPFKKSLFNLPIFRPCGSQTQKPAHCFGASNRSTGHAPLPAARVAVCDIVLCSSLGPARAALSGALALMVLTVL